MGLTLVRHAQPLVAQGICYGALDVPADALATDSAAQALAQWIPIDCQVAFSPLQRCAQLATALQHLRPKLRTTSQADLREMDFGAWEGQRWDSIAASELKAWTDDFAQYRCGGAGESTSIFVSRVYRALQGIDPAQPTLWITHAGVMRATVWLRQQGFLTRSYRHSYQDCGPARWDALAAADWPQDALGFGQHWQLDWPD